MCGIYGIIHIDGEPVAPELIDAMGAITRHRGPDDEGRYHDGPCVLGMRRLSIIDLAGGHQPLTNTDRTLWVVCNGEIYNFRELRQALEVKGHRFLTASDSECVIHAYAEWGDEFVRKLSGMFGFALWDVKRRRLIIGRDRMGIKPIYYYNDGRQMVFATEAKAILTLPHFPVRVDPIALESYLQLGYVAAPRSIFEGIRKLPPATLMIVENGRVAQRTYWAIPESIDHSRDEDQWAEQVREHMERAVAAQMVSDVPIGAFLSGGIDSSAVVGLMAKHSSQPIRTYSIGFGGSSADDFYNELPYAKRVAELFATQHHEIVVRPDVASLLPKLLWHMDEPIADTAFLTTYLVSQFARQEVKVILSGVGGDELFGGYRRYLGSHYLARFDRLPRWVRRSALRASELLPSDRHSGVLNVMRLAKGFLASADLSFEERYRAYVQVFRAEQAARLMRVAPSRRVDPIGEAFSKARGDDQLNRMFAVDGATQLPDDLLMLTDKMSMAVSLECRVPLLDHELVELAAGMPESIKIRGGELKYAMKKSLEGLLPLDILHRKKRGFGTPMGAWLKGGLAPLLDQVLSEHSVAERGLFNHAAIRELISAHRQNREDNTDQLLTLMNFEIWARMYLDRRAPQDVADELKEAIA